LQLATFESAGVAQRGFLGAHIFSAFTAGSKVVFN